MTTATPDNWTDWIGRSETVRDTITLHPAQALAATFDAGLALQDGDALPHLWHWIYFTPLTATAELGEDGHPRKGGFLPPITLPRRMWAGSRLSFHQPLRIGECAERTSTIASISEKSGGSGRLVFVTVRHQISNGDGLVLEEEQDLVYREAQPTASSATNATALPGVEATATAEWQWRQELVPDPVLLFRYSALTFNSHRIHYDQDYARTVEGYPGLVVHGPLLATLLMDLHRRQRPDTPVHGFSFRARSPLFANTPLALCGRPQEGKRVELEAQSSTGATAVSATITYA